MSIFKPVWQSKNIKKRIKAVSTLEDREILKALAADDPSILVRSPAVERLVALGCSDDVFLDIIQKNSYYDAEESAMTKISNRQSYLYLLQMSSKMISRKLYNLILHHFEEDEIKNMILENSEKAYAVKLIVFVQDKEFLLKIIDDPAYSDDIRNEADNIFGKISSVDFEIVGDALKRYKGSSKRIILPRTIERIDVNAFAGNGSVHVEEIFLHTVINDTSLTAMFKLSGLKKVAISDNQSVFRVKDGVLYSKDGRILQFFPPGKAGKYVLPKEVNEISEMAYRSLYFSCSLEHIDVEGGNEQFCAADGILFNQDLSKLIYCPSGRKKAVFVPTETEHIEIRAFRNCAFLEDVRLPKENYRDFLCQLFEGCKGLNQAQFGHRLTEPMELNETNYRDDDDMKASNSSFVYVQCVHCEQKWTSDMKNYPAQTKEPALIQWKRDELSSYIGKSETIVLPPSIKKIFALAFKDTQGIRFVELHQALLPPFIPALQYIKSLESVSIRDEHPEYRAIDGVLYTEDMSALVLFPPKKIGSFTLPSAVIHIDSDIIELIEQALYITDVKVEVGNQRFYVESKAIKKKNI